MTAKRKLESDSRKRDKALRELRDLIATVEKAPLIDGVYVLADDIKLSPEARSALIADLRQQLLALVRDELQARPDLYHRYPDGSYDLKENALTVIDGKPPAGA